MTQWDFFLLKVNTIEIKSHASEKEVASAVLRRDCPFSSAQVHYRETKTIIAVHLHVCPMPLNYLKMLIYRNLMQLQSCHLRRCVSQVRRLLTKAQITQMQMRSVVICVSLLGGCHL